MPTSKQVRRRAPFALAVFLTACGQAPSFMQGWSGAARSGKDESKARSNDPEKPTDGSEGVPGYLWDGDDLGVTVSVASETQIVTVTAGEGVIFNDFGSPADVIATLLTIEPNELERTVDTPTVLAAAPLADANAEGDGSLAVDAQLIGAGPLVLVLGSSVAQDGAPVPAMCLEKVQVVLLDPSGTRAPMALCGDNLPMQWVSAGDTAPPTAPTALVADSVSDVAVTLSWSASTDNVGIDHYEISRDGSVIGTSISPTYDDGGLLASTSYSYTVSALDAAGNQSSDSAPLSITTGVNPNLPNAPTGLLLADFHAHDLTIQWDAVAALVPIVGYIVYREGIEIQRTACEACIAIFDGQLTATTTYTYTVAAYDAEGHLSPRSAPLAATTGDDPLSTATVLIDDFSEVLYIPSNAVNGQGQPTYNGCAAAGERCIWAYMYLAGANVQTVVETGLDAAHVLGGGRTIQLTGNSIPDAGATLFPASAFYFSVGSYAISFGNDAETALNSDSVAMLYTGSIATNSIQEFVLLTRSGDSPVSSCEIIVEISDGTNTASYMQNGVSGTTPVELVFPLAQMTGIGSLGATIISVRLEIKSGTWGMDSSYTGFFAR